MEKSQKQKLEEDLKSCISLGLCTSCKKAPNIEGKLWCERCIEEFRIKNRLKIRNRRASKRGSEGISYEDFEKLLMNQNGRCKICGKKPELPYDLVVDHDHRAGKIRGLLCLQCNIGIGMFMDDPETLIAASDYITYFQLKNSKAY